MGNDTTIDIGNPRHFWEVTPNMNTNATTINVDDIESTNEAESSPRQYRKGWRKPRGMPKRPMSSYNLFFQLERERLVNDEEERVFTPEDIDRIAKIQKLKDMSCQKRKHRKSHGKISFSKLARVIADKWKALDNSSKAAFFERAAREKDEYKVAVEEWARSNNNTSSSRASSPTLEFLSEPIESPPSCNDQYPVQYQSSNTSPEIAFPTQLESTHREMWDGTDNNTAVAHSMMNTVVEGSWIEKDSSDRKSSVFYNSDKLEPSSLHSIRKAHSFQSPPRRQLQPRFVPFNADFVAQSGHYGVNNGPTSYLHPMKIPDQHMKYSPASAISNIYSPNFADTSYLNCNLSPSQNIFIQSGDQSLRSHMKLMRSRSFPVEERHFIANEMMQQQCMQLSSDERAHSQPNLYHASAYGTTRDLACMPLDALVEVSPGQYIDPKVYNIDTGSPHQFVQRRSTFSGGYNMEDARLNPRYSPSNMINQSPRPESRRRLSDMDAGKNFPPLEFITVCRKRQESFPEQQDYATENRMYGNPPLGSSQCSQDHILGTYISKHHFPNDSNHVYINEEEEKAALDLVSLAGNQSQRSTFASKPPDETKSPIYHHSDHHHSVSISEDRDTSEPNTVGLPVNYHDDTPYNANHWEV